MIRILFLQDIYFFLFIRIRGRHSRRQDNRFRLLPGCKTHFSRHNIDFRHSRLFAYLETGTQNRHLRHSRMNGKGACLVPLHLEKSFSGHLHYTPFLSIFLHIIPECRISGHRYQCTIRQINIFQLPRYSNDRYPFGIIPLFHIKSAESNKQEHNRGSRHPITAESDLATDSLSGNKPLPSLILIQASLFVAPGYKSIILLVVHHFN